MQSTQLSVVIASVNGWRYLSPCLAALAAQEGKVRAEIIVCDVVGPEVREQVRPTHPGVRLVPFESGTSVPELRRAGIMAAQGEIVAITEDHCIPAPDWFRSLVRAHAAHPGTAIGGSVDNGAVDRHVDRAVFFCEYSNFLSPVDSGVVHDLPGPNVSYKRAALLGVPDALTDGYWETFLHARLEQDGDALWSDPALKVVHKKHFQSQEFLWERYHYGRAYAGRRNEHMGPPRRLVYLAGSFLLPPVLLGRIARRVWGRRQHRRMFTLSLPLLLLFLSAGAVGEFVGTLAGPGDSAKRLS